MANTETIKETIVPTISTVISFDVNLSPTSEIYLYILKSDAPAMAGNAKKNEYSAAIGRDVPKIIPPIIVDPLLDVPGIIDSV